MTQNTACSKTHWILCVMNKCGSIRYQSSVVSTCIWAFLKYADFRTRIKTTPFYFYNSCSSTGLLGFKYLNMRNVTYIGILSKTDFLHRKKNICGILDFSTFAYHAGLNQSAMQHSTDAGDALKLQPNAQRTINALVPQSAEPPPQKKTW